MPDLLSPDCCCLFAPDCSPLTAGARQRGRRRVPGARHQVRRQRQRGRVRAADTLLRLLPGCQGARAGRVIGHAPPPPAPAHAPPLCSIACCRAWAPPIADCCCTSAPRGLYLPGMPELWSPQRTFACSARNQSLCRTDFLLALLGVQASQLLPADRAAVAGPASAAGAWGGLPCAEPGPGLALQVRARPQALRDWSRAAAASLTLSLQALWAAAGTAAAWGCLDKAALEASLCTA